MHESDRDRQRLERDICRAVSAAEEGTLQETDREKLNAALSKHQHARRLYLDLIALRVLLKSIAGRSLRRETEDRAIQLASRLPAAAHGNLTTQRESGFSRRVMGIAIAATLLLAVTGVAIIRPGEYQVGPEVVESDDQTPADAKMIRSDRVATVRGVSEGCVWNDPNKSLAVDAVLHAGRVVRISRGKVDLVYNSGVEIELIGPAEYQLKPEGGILVAGGLLASVPEAGHGFTVETPNGKVVDLGTEFGVVVDDFGFSEVGVFKGKVEAYPITQLPTQAGANSPLELTEGDGLLWTNNSLTRIETDARRFGSNSAIGFPGNATHLASRDPRVSEAPRPTAQANWLELGRVKRTGNGFELRASASDPRPLLVSREEYDPAAGPILVECDMVFPRGAVESPSVAILTRSDKRRGKAAAPWNDLLATCVRCSFGTSPDAGVGVLDAATKHESGWEPITLSWEGFGAPTPGERYHLSMTDDGVNISFTVALAGNPAVSKTVRCRSLFRGVANHVAIEGSSDGAVQVQNVQVYQQSMPPSGRSGEPDDLAALAGVPSGPSGLGVDVESLFPKDSELVIAENFDTNRLDSARWETLGKVYLETGRVRLGDFSDGSPIDTWCPRPHLVSRDAFSPAKGPVTVVGTIEFSENYLDGFGGSFAVVTRSTPAYRGGEGWERSLLSRGIRSNFWPSGLEIGRSLEIHSIAPAGPVPLLANASFDVTPHSRTYHFRTIDNGKEVRMTLIDANNPRRSAEVAFEIGQTAGKPHKHRIAFESTCGSPITLQEVHIFQSATSDK